MPHTPRVLLGLLLAACCCPATTAAEQSGLRLWPFRGDRVDDSPLTGNSLGPKTPATTTGGASAAMSSQPPTTSYTTDALPEQHWMFQSPLARVSWPRIHMPELSLPKPNLPRPQIWPRKSEVDDARNGWVQNSPDSARPTPLQAMQQGAQRVGNSTRTAWRKTVDALTPARRQRVRSAGRQSGRGADVVAAHCAGAARAEAGLTDDQRIHRPGTAQSLIARL